MIELSITILNFKIKDFMSLCNLSEGQGAKHTQDFYCQEYTIMAFWVIVIGGYICSGHNNLNIFNEAVKHINKLMKIELLFQHKTLGVLILKLYNLNNMLVFPKKYGLIDGIRYFFCRFAVTCFQPISSLFICSSFIPVSD